MEKEEIELLNQIEYVNLESIDYVNEYPMAVHKRLDEPGIFTEEDYKECLGKLYPYRWIDKDSTYNDQTYIDIIGVVPTDDGSMVNIKLSLINKDSLIKFLQENQTFLEQYLLIQSDFGKNLNSRIKHH